MNTALLPCRHPHLIQSLRRGQQVAAQLVNLKGPGHMPVVHTAIIDQVCVPACSNTDNST